MVTFTDHNIIIGCQIHSVKEWTEFTNEQISDMSEGALEFWNQYRSIILAIAKNHQSDVQKQGEK